MQKINSIATPGFYTLFRTLRLWSSETWHHVVWYTDPNILKEPADSIFRGEAGSFQLLVRVCCTLWYHIWVGCSVLCPKGPRSSPFWYPWRLTECGEYHILTTVTQLKLCCPLLGYKSCHYLSVGVPESAFCKPRNLSLNYNKVQRGKWELLQENSCPKDGTSLMVQQ
jgi:hypothetical protein